MAFIHGLNPDIIKIADSLKFAPFLKKDGFHALANILAP